MSGIAKGSGLYEGSIASLTYIILFDMPVDGERLFVSEAFHEARIEVTEDGTKAGSATGM